MRSAILSSAALMGLMICAPLAAQSTNAAQPAKASPCADHKYHQFDFWVGKWDVYGPKGKMVAHSLIESVYGCGIRENWMPLGGGGPGGSLSIYVPAEKQWEQFWIDSQGSRAIFTGGFNGKSMVITGKWGGPLVRMTYTKNPDGSVRQFGQNSTNSGKTWTPSFDFIYRPAA